MEIFKLIVVAILVEAIWENLKMVWDNGKASIDRIGALVFGILICVLTGIDIFPIVSIPIAVPFVGNILTGIIVSRGANFVHDLFEKINAYKTTN